MFEKLGRLLPSSLKRSGEVRRGVEAAVVIEAARAAIHITFGPDVAGHCRAASFKDGTLKIACDRSVYAETIRLREQELLDAVNKRVGGGTVRGIRTA